MQASLGLRSSLWSYNPMLIAWEPVIEPWDVIIKLDSNRSHEVRKWLGTLAVNMSWVRLLLFEILLLVRLQPCMFSAGGTCDAPWDKPNGDVHQRGGAHHIGLRCCRHTDGCLSRVEGMPCFMSNCRTRALMTPLVQQC